MYGICMYGARLVRVMMWSYGMMPCQTPCNSVFAHATRRICPMGMMYKQRGDVLTARHACKDLASTFFKNVLADWVLLRLRLRLRLSWVSTCVRELTGKWGHDSRVCSLVALNFKILDSCPQRDLWHPQRATCKRKSFRFEQYPFRVHVGLSEIVWHQCETECWQKFKFFLSLHRWWFSLVIMLWHCKMCYTCFSLAKSFSISYRPWYRSGYVHVCQIMSDRAVDNSNIP